MKYFIVVGERSGDLHAAKMIQQIRLNDADAVFDGYGGDYMSEVGCTIHSHFKEAAFMGFWEVVKNISKIRKRLSHCKELLNALKPDVLILVDYPGFNLRLAKYARKKAISTAYYISPKIWAWKQGRIKIIRACVDRMYVIFPFEVSFYKRLNYQTYFLGNPVVEEIREHVLDQSWIDSSIDKARTNILIMAGSREQEIRASLEMISELSSIHPDYLFWVAGVDSVNNDLYAPINDLSNVKVVFGKTYELMSSCKAAIVTSGTATLEAALWGLPQLVCYRTSSLTYAIARLFLKIKYISLVNILANKRVVTELIQQHYTPSRITEELDQLLNNTNRIKEIKKAYDDIKVLLTERNASREIATDLVKNFIKPL
ncbi:MAG: lipid-A-disaccharide synthase [Cyclobacteriaceae bacterium]